MTRRTISSTPSWKAVAVAAVVAASALTGCASTDPENPMRLGARDAPVRITVQNHDFYDAVIYANWIGSTRERVGMVTGKTSETFSMNWRSERVWFEADFVSGGTVRFEPVDVWGGDHLDLVIMIQG